MKKECNRKDIRIPRSSDMDLRRWENCVKTVKNIDIVIHLAAKVGGIGYNQAYPAATFFMIMLLWVFK